MLGAVKRPRLELLLGCYWLVACTGSSAEPRLASRRAVAEPRNTPASLPVGPSPGTPEAAAQQARLPHYTVDASNLDRLRVPATLPPSPGDPLPAPGRR